jgi:hypothetical protein
MFLERDFSISESFQAYKRSIIAIHQLKHMNILVTLGEDEEIISPTVKIWNLDKKDKSGVKALVLRSVKFPKLVVSNNEEKNHANFVRLPASQYPKIFLNLRSDLLRESLY